VGAKEMNREEIIKELRMMDEDAPYGYKWMSIGRAERIAE
jgi:hypothetical protein